MLVGAVVALAAAPAARADHLAPIPPSTASPVVNNVGGSGGTYRITGAAQAAIAARGYEPLAAPWSPTGTNSIPSTINKMQRKGRVLPALNALGFVGVVTGGVLMGWEIGESIGGSEFIYKKLFGGDEFGEPSAQVGAPGWKHDDWNVTKFGEGSPTAYPDHWAFISAETGWLAFYCVATGGTCHSAFTNWTPVANAVTVGTKVRATDSTCGGSGARECWINLATEAEYEAALDVSTEDEAAHNARPAGQRKSTVYVVPADLGTDADNDASGGALVDPDGSQDPGQKATEEAICEDLFPGECVNPYVLDLPAPEVNETYAQYLARLQAAGYVGAATEDVATTESSLYGPSAVMRVTIASVPARVLDPLAWPSAAVSISENVGLTIRTNAPTAAPLPTEGTTAPPAQPTTGAVDEDADCPCPVRSLDLDPLTTVPVGTAFPFGVVTWGVNGMQGLTSGTTTAPTFCMPLLGDYDCIPVDLAILDPVMPLWRALVLYATLVGAIITIGRTALGWGAKDEQLSLF